jgi:hypothetical protein
MVMLGIGHCSSHDEGMDYTIAGILNSGSGIKVVTICNRMASCEDIMWSVRLHVAVEKEVIC